MRQVSPSVPGTPLRPCHRRPTTLTLGVAALMLALATASSLGSAQRVSLTPGRTLRIEFITTPPFIETNPNVLSVQLGYVNLAAPYGRITGSLYDGEVLLGTAYSTLGAGYTGRYSFHPLPVSWKTADSPWNPWAHAGPGNEPAVVDFTTLHDGTIRGRMDISIDAGQIDFAYRDVGLSTTFATYTNGGSSIPPYPRIISMRLLPELPGDPVPPTYPPTPPAPPVDLDEDDDRNVTPQEFKTACETGEGNAVILDHGIKVTGTGALVSVNAACTLILRGTASIEFNRTTFAFAEPLTIQSAQKAAVKLERSLLGAPSINVNLTGAGSALAMKDSALRAEGGDLLAVLGDDGKLEVQGRFASAGLSLGASGAMHIRGGRKLSAQFLSATATAAGDLTLDMVGAEGGLKADGSTFTSTTGSVNVIGGQAKSLIEMKGASLLARQIAAIRLAGADTTIKLQQVRLAAAPGTPIAALALVEAGSAGAGGGVIEMSESTIVNVGGFGARASHGGTKGLLKFEKNSVQTAGAVVLESGQQGTTEEKDNTIRGSARIRVATGLDGSCSSSSALQAPILEICQ